MNALKDVCEFIKKHANHIYKLLEEHHQKEVSRAINELRDALKDLPEEYNEEIDLKKYFSAIKLPIKLYPENLPRHQELLNYVLQNFERLYNALKEKKKEEAEKALNDLEGIFFELAYMADFNDIKPELKEIGYSWEKFDKIRRSLKDINVDEINVEELKRYLEEIYDVMKNIDDISSKIAKLTGILMWVDRYPKEKAYKILLNIKKNENIDELVKSIDEIVKETKKEYRQEIE